MMKQNGLNLRLVSRDVSQRSSMKKDPRLMMNQMGKGPQQMDLYMLKQHGLNPSMVSRGVSMPRQTIC